ncbi:D-alanyl-D-alanine carboxypeptidase family protein [Maricaulis sp. CAU 1757]
MSQLVRSCLALIALTLSSALVSSPAAANERYAAFVVDQNTGLVLHSRRSEDERYPASLTKMMTLYMLFEAIEAGETSLSDDITISRTAANAVPSRLGIAPGGTISVENAIRALVVKSANDVAVAVGEHLAGTESAFAEAMTARAAELGMVNTVFRNASGLPDSEQHTTARDMARLGISLHRDFPQYFSYFQEERFRWNGRTYRNHNSLVGRVEGVDGLKTGYIRASGFNVVVSATRGDHRLVTVVMGGPSSSARDAHAEELLEAAFATLEQREDTRLFAALSSPRINPVRQQALIAQDIAALDLADPTEMGSSQEAPPVRIVLTDTDNMPRRSLPTAAVETATLDRLPPAEPRARVATESAPEPAAAPRLLRGAWAIQVGAYNSAEAAHDRLALIAANALAPREAQPAARAVELGGSRLWRARFEALTEAEAVAACRTLLGRNEACFTVAPDA